VSSVINVKQEQECFVNEDANRIVFTKGAKSIVWKWKFDASKVKFGTLS
jgi:hypothetical protein